jgi:hypothetical protein
MLASLLCLDIATVAATTGVLLLFGFRASETADETNTESSYERILYNTAVVDGHAVGLETFVCWNSGAGLNARACQPGGWVKQTDLSATRKPKRTQR